MVKLVSFILPPQSEPNPMSLVCSIQALGIHTMTVTAALLVLKRARGLMRTYNYAYQQQELRKYEQQQQQEHSMGTSSQSISNGVGTSRQSVGTPRQCHNDGAGICFIGQTKKDSTDASRQSGNDSTGVLRQSKHALSQEQALRRQLETMQQGLRSSFTSSINWTSSYHSNRWTRQALGSTNPLLQK
eukprot:scaffold302599_cov22-Tisochrysis_lutea.AAC.1